MSDRRQRIQQTQASLEDALEQATRRGVSDRKEFIELLKMTCTIDSLQNDHGFVHSERTIIRRLAELAADNPRFAAVLPMLVSAPKPRVVAGTENKTL
jgi:hypothetical protein